MRVLESLEQLEDAPPDVILTIGNCDGVHRGHQKLFSLVVEEAQRIGGTSVLLTFAPHPAKILRPDVAPPLLTTREQKLALVEAAGLDLVLIQPFSEILCRTTATDFIESMVVPRLKPRAIIIGTPFRFGHNREGDVQLLQGLGGRLGFRAEGVGVVDEEGVTISSTRIRRSLLAGRAAEAARMLGRPYKVLGTVVSGDSRGRTLSIPTANLDLENELIPADGVYVTRLRIGDELLGSVTNIGVRPTFQGTERVVESHILNYQGQIYDRRVGLVFLERLRDEVRFPSAEALLEQIGRDVARAREILEAP